MKKILSIDGGGIRGMLPARLLHEFEKTLIQQGYTPIFYPHASDCLSAVAARKVTAAVVSSLFFEQQSYHVRYSSLV